MKTIIKISFFFGFSLWLISCESEFIPAIVNEPPKMVVEGYIEANPSDPANAALTYIMLTRSVPFFQEIDANTLNDLFVHGAEVSVFDGQTNYPLTEICWDDLPEEIRQQAASQFGLNTDSVQINFCIYANFALKGEVGKSYQLHVKAENQEITASTTIPVHTSLDSVYFAAPPGDPNDTLAQCLVYISDPGNTTNYYRYYTSINGRPYLAGTASIFSDEFFNGQHFLIPLPKAEPVARQASDIDLNTFGLYTVGDTVGIKWCNMDKAHFDFWNTWQKEQSNGGPFSSYTRIQSNIQGGLGVWGGYSVSYYHLIVPSR